ncbi:MAG: plastocyanin/azurin family copper-binding protein [Flavobacteriaceae bacterium]
MQSLEFDVWKNFPYSKGYPQSLHQKDQAQEVPAISAACFLMRTSIFRGLGGLDETYVHDKISADISILMERVEGDHREPWTWTKTHGKGKVFYTAYGHDERTWSNIGFQKLIKQGILWAVNASVKEKWAAYAQDIPQLVYEDRAGIPNYEKRDPVPKYQLPLSPEESKKLTQIPPGFRLELFASEPDIINPIAMNWDEKGRLWVIETVDYPNTVRDDKGSGDDRIKICEDTNGDGKADKFTIFAEGLNIPTSFTFANGGIVVSQAPHFLFLKDEDGDDKADIKEILIDGWGVYDTHAGPSNLQRGIDNKIYGVVGYSGFKGTIAGQSHEFSQGIYRFESDLSDFEFVTNTSNNTWGLGFNENNAMFASTANNTHSVFMGIPNRFYEGVEGIPNRGSIKIDGHYNMQAITPNIRQVDVFGGFTAAAGHHFYTARDYPSSYWNKVAFVCEPTGNLVHIAKIVKDGAGYKEENGGNLIASADEWFSPVEAKVGPDGQVWILDWYNFIIQHNPTPTIESSGFAATNGAGNAYMNPLRDKSKGRIWRLVYKGSESQKEHNLDSTKNLVETLSDDNLFWRMTAQRLLIEKDDTSVLSDLYALVKNDKVDAMGLNPGALHALWTIQGFGALNTAEANAVVASALSHKAASVRRAALQLLPRNIASDALVTKANLLYDNDHEVQLATLLYWAERPASAAVGKALYHLNEDESIAKDNWLTQAMYIAGGGHRAGFVQEFEKENPDFSIVPKKEEKREKKNYDDSDWKTMKLPRYIEDAGLEIDGIVWFRKHFTISGRAASQKAKVSLGPIDDSDVVYINGARIGGLENSYTKNRVYDIAVGILKPGDNVISIRVEDTGGNGGVYGKPEQMFLQSKGSKVPLHGNWKYDVEEDFANSSKSIFEEVALAELLVKNYKNKPLPVNATSDSSENATRITIKTIQNQMKYSVTKFEVEAGKPVEIVFDNNDFMQHNIVIIKPGEKETVGAAADKMAMAADGAERNYVPNMPEILFATAIINPNDKGVLKFTAPTEPGIYPYICTFPGHWRIMQGTMIVVAAK